MGEILKMKSQFIADIKTKHKYSSVLILSRFNGACTSMKTCQYHVKYDKIIYPVRS